MGTYLEVQGDIEALAGRWREERPDRQARRSLDAADFEELARIGVLRAAVPVELGGTYAGAAASTRGLCEVLRSLAGADPSVALVSAMHPAVLGYWLNAPPDGGAAWEEQRRAVLGSALDGAQWGTITSEPGSGGDMLRTRARAEPGGPDIGLPGRRARVSGAKHFGSGSGVADYMITTAVMDGDDEPSFFVLDTSDRRWDGSAGMTMLAEWDGMGMRATQSHAMVLDGAPAVQLAHDAPIQAVAGANAAFVSCLFTAVVLGVLDEAVATARAALAPKADQLRAYERVEWTRAEAEHWLAVQAYEGGLRAVESDELAVAVHAGLRAKECVAELAEQSLTRLSRVIGGGTFSQRSPFAAWFEDVRALGFLRPPWGLAYDSLFDTSLRDPASP